MQLLEHSYCRLHNVFATPITWIISLFLLIHFTPVSAADVVAQEDHNHHRLLELQSKVYGTLNHGSDLELGEYESNFIGADRSMIGRADAPQVLANNYPGKDNIDSGDTQVWTFPKKEIAQKSARALAAHTSLAERDAWDRAQLSDDVENRALRQRQTDTATLFITLNICDQPQPKIQNFHEAPASLQLYISTDPKNRSPDEKNNDYNVSIKNGYGVQSFSASDDVYLSVTAPEKSSQFAGGYSYELTASVDHAFTTYIDEDEMVFVDSDTHAALLSSNRSTDVSKYGIFVHPQDDQTILGLSSSYCGLKNWARIKGNIDDLSTGDVDTGVMKMGGNETRQQFYVKNLNGSTAYYGIMALNGDSTGNKDTNGSSAGGGKIWKAMNFTTKASGNCAVIYNLTFCSSVAYAVPSNDTNLNHTELTLLYDNDARNKYQNFRKSLQQIPCNTTSSAQYSLARTCDDCDKAYRTWLCAVTIPRCEDFSSNLSYLVPRLISKTFTNGSIALGLNEAPYTAENKSVLYLNSSRNPMIDESIMPGPYREMLPCKDLCYEIVRSCPANLEFACPLKKHGLDRAYGEDGACSYPGAPFKQNLATGLRVTLWCFGVALLVALTNSVRV
ncbi:MAG: stretch-activated cation channel mid1 [Heterodermia speciosa]|uniref:Stretch-activated cation channel mid1 n=1 Tax=Heterodermia speciosa TaxID=116794 RepID=A0A8H3G922_9LECA|nr:MAG: stretch-activated cation channel mid1 [Heterodermia speciosa]